MGGHGKAYFEYNQSTMQEAISHIKDMSANMCGNNLIEPLSLAIDKLATGHKEVRIFVLTDGREDPGKDVVCI